MKPRLLILFLFVSIYSFGQTEPDSTAEQYCLVRIYFFSLSNKVEVSADYGFNKKSRYRREVIKDENGKRKVFLSEADALNFFGSEGWKLVNAFPVSEYRDNYTRYIFKRSAPISEVEISN
ncbi:MAG: hypothetical protein ABIR18_05095 [Chitinophagaceae bacterium]